MTNEESIFLETGLLEQYALNLCSEKEEKDVEVMLARSEEVSKHYENLQKNLEQLAKVKAVKPPQHLKDEIMKFIHESEEGGQVHSIMTSQETPLDRHSNIWAIAAGLALLISLGFLFQQYQSTQRLQAELETLREIQIADNQRLKAIRTELAFLQDLDTRQLVLSTTQDGSPFKLTAYWNEVDGQVLLDSKGVPSAPTGKCYQLWADVDGEMLSVAVLTSDNPILTSGTFYSEATSLNITLEDKPGSDHATVTALVVSVEV